MLVNIASGKWESRESGIGRNGKPVREVLLSSLPRELQVKWVDRNRPQPSPVIGVPADTPPPDTELRLTETLKRYQVDERDAFLNEARRLSAIVARYDAIEPKRQPVPGAAVKKLEFVSAVLHLCREAICTDDVVLSREPRRAQCPSPYTLEGWSRRCKTDGLLTFLRSPANWKSNSERMTSAPRKTDRRRAVISARAVEWVNENWRSSPTARSLYKKLVKRARKEGWTIPSESWLYRKYKSLPKIVQTSVFEGQKAYTAKCQPFYQRDNRDLEALQMLCGDHSKRDVTVRLRDGSLTRPWLTLWLDLRLYLIWGWHLDLIPSSTTIGLAYANGVRTFGAQPPAREGYQSYVYTDQGKDYKSQDFTGKTLVFKQAARIDGALSFLLEHRKVGLLNDLGGVQQILARGYNAREKQVERVHRDISTAEQSTFSEAEYCGRDAKNKPDAWRDAWARHERLLKRARGGNHLLLDDSPFMTLDDYREWISGWINEHNNSVHEMGTLGGAKIVPIEEYQRLYTTHYTISEETLALLLMKATDSPRQIRKNGIWLHQRQWWYMHPAMSEYQDSYVEVRYDDADYSRCWVVLPNGDLCEAGLATPGAIRNPNRETLRMIKRQEASQKQTIRDFNLLTQSILRGETTEDRVAALIEPEEEEERVAVAAGGAARSFSDSSIGTSARVHQLTRLDRPKLRATAQQIQSVTVDEVSRIQADESIFDSRDTGRVKEFDFEE